MGNECCSPAQPQRGVNTLHLLADDNYKRWVDGVFSENLNEMKIAHKSDPLIIDKSVDDYGSCAIHIAIRDQNMEIIEYLLSNNVNVNIRGGKLYNTALHEAVIVSDISIIHKLFTYGIDDSINNIYNKKAIDLCGKQLKPKMFNIKREILKNKKKIKKKKKKNKKKKNVYVTVNDENSKRFDSIIKNHQNQDNQDGITLNLQIKSHDMTYPIFSLKIDNNVTVQSLKDKIAEETPDKIESNKQRLIHRGRLLKDLRSLTYYKFANNDTIHLVRSTNTLSSIPGPPSLHRSATVSHSRRVMRSQTPGP